MASAEPLLKVGDKVRVSRKFSVGTVVQVIRGSTISYTVKVQMQGRSGDDRRPPFPELTVVEDELEPG
jgi:hypothetical protein